MQFQVTIDTPTPDQTLITNTASNSYEAQTNPTLGLSDTSTPTLSTVTAPDLVMTKTDAGGFGAGGSSGFTLPLSNAGNSPSQGLVTVTDTVPASLPVTGASGSGWSCGVATQTVTLHPQRRDLPRGRAIPISRWRQRGRLRSAVDHQHRLGVGWAGWRSLKQRRQRHRHGFPAADLGPLKTMTPMQPIAGEPVSFTITTTNQGPSDATGAVVTDPSRPRSPASRRPPARHLHDHGRRLLPDRYRSRASAT